MFHIKSIVPKILQRQGIKDQVEVVKICRMIDSMLEEKFGKKSAKVAFFHNGTLQIKCPNSVLANEVQLHKERIKNEINEELNREVVRSILTKVN
jgi:uncharacterized membrane protein YheB (UPF0754 family)